MNKKLLILFGIIALIGCEKNDNAGIVVDIERKDDVLFTDVFSRIELVPLETNSESLIKLIDKVMVYQQRFYVLDIRQAILFIFDANGKFIGKISNKGIGPDEYINISDFEIDVKHDKIMLLSSVDRTLHVYDLDGHFEKKRKLPIIQGTYGTCKLLSDDILVFWTSDEKNRLKFYSLTVDKIISECFREKDNNYNIFLRTRFPYDAILARSSQNQLYSLAEDGKVSEAYCWNFGRLNNELRNKPEGGSQLGLPEFVRKVYDSEIVNYIFTLHGGNSRYIYTQLYRHNKPVNIFYDKKTSDCMVFEKFVEGAYIYPFLWKEDYVIGIPDWQYDLEQTVPDVLLDSIEIQKKHAWNETDNPVLIKYYFK